MVLRKGSWIFASLLFGIFALPAAAQRPRPWLGVSIDPNSAGGVIIRDVESNGPADVAWLRPGDVILGIVVGGKNDRPVHTFADLTKVMSQLADGDTVTVRYQRGNKKRVTEVTVRAETITRPTRAN